MRIRVVERPSRDRQRYECFGCGLELHVPERLTYCPECGNEDDWFVMS